MGMMAFPFSINVMCVVAGRTANLDSERGRMSPKISSPLRRNISEMWSSRTPSASPCMKRNGGLGGLEFIGSEIVWLQIHRDDALDEVRELVGRRTELFVFGLDGRAGVFACSWRVAFPPQSFEPRSDLGTLDYRRAVHHQRDVDVAARRTRVRAQLVRGTHQIGGQLGILD